MFLSEPLQLRKSPFHRYRILKNKLKWVKDLAIEQDGMKSDPLPTELNQLRYKRDHIHQMMNYPPTKDLELSYDDICIISRYLSKDRMFNKSFDMYLKQILSVSNEPAVQIRTKD